MCLYKPNAKIRIRKLAAIVSKDNFFIWSPRLPRSLARSLQAFLVPSSLEVKRAGGGRGSLRFKILPISNTILTHAAHSRQQQCCLFCFRFVGNIKKFNCSGKPYACICAIFLVVPLCVSQFFSAQLSASRRYSITTRRNEFNAELTEEIVCVRRTIYRRLSPRFGSRPARQFLKNF